MTSAASASIAWPDARSLRPWLPQRWAIIAMFTTVAAVAAVVSYMAAGPTAAITVGAVVTVVLHRILASGDVSVRGRSSCRLRHREAGRPGHLHLPGAAEIIAPALALD